MAQQGPMYRKGKFRQRKSKPPRVRPSRSFLAAENFDEVLPLTSRLRGVLEEEIVDDQLRAKKTKLPREFWGMNDGRLTAAGREGGRWQRLRDMTSTRIRGWASRRTN